MRTPANPQEGDPRVDPGGLSDEREGQGRGTLPVKLLQETMILAASLTRR